MRLKVRWSASCVGIMGHFSNPPAWTIREPISQNVACHLQVSLTVWTLWRTVNKVMWFVFLFFPSAHAFLLFCFFFQRRVACTPMVLGFGEWKVQKGTGNLQMTKFVLMYKGKLKSFVLRYCSLVHCIVIPCCGKAGTNWNKTIWVLNLIKTPIQKFLH